MKSNQSVVLKSRLGDEITLDLMKDLEKVQAFLKTSLSTALRFPIFQELRIAIRVSELDKNVARLLTPTYNADNLYLIVFFSEINELYKIDEVYIKWEYHHYDGFVYTTDDYIDLDGTIKVDKLLTT